MVTVVLTAVSTLTVRSVADSTVVNCTTSSELATSLPAGRPLSTQHNSHAGTYLGDTLKRILRRAMSQVTATTQLEQTRSAALRVLTIIRCHDNGNDCAVVV